MKLFIGSLPFNISETDLIELFSQYGSVLSVNVVTDHFTGNPKGFAFIEMDSRSSGQQAMESLNKRVYKSRPLVCNEAKPQKKGNRRR